MLAGLHILQKDSIPMYSAARVSQVMVQEEDLEDTEELRDMVDPEVKDQTAGTVAMVEMQMAEKEEMVDAAETQKHYVL